jgi:serpin B
MRRSLRWSLVVVLAVVVVFVYVFRQNVAATPPKPPTSPDALSVVRGGNEFAFDLYAKLRADKDGNLFFSPQSISTALAMTYAGARGDTAKQMAGVLHFDLPPGKLHPAQAALLNYLNAIGQRGDVKLSVANRLWGQQGYKFLKDFTTLLKSEYGAGLEQLDFAQSEAARQTINAWVEKATADKIKDLIPDGVLDSLTRLVLTNAVYFKGDWEEAFDKKLTKPHDFHLTATSKAEGVPLMFQKHDYRYAQGKFAADQGLKLIELPYKGNELSMVVLLPDEIDGLAKLEKNLTADNVQKWLDAAQTTEVKLWLPKFKMTDEFQLGNILSAMGMTDLFDRMKADLSGMDDKKDLFVSAVLHKAFVDVNEQGTEAAAATGAVVTLKAAVPQETPTFRADHPFVFLIRDNATGAILFMGRVVDPR